MAVKKQWYEIIAPKMFDEKTIGEALAADPRELMGRTIETSLAELDRAMTKFYMKLKFQVTRTEGSKAYTEFVSHSVMYERIYRIVQRHMRRVDCIQDITTKDGKRIRVKTIFVIARRVNTSLKKATRHAAEELVEKAVQNYTLEELINAILDDELQQSIRKELNKIYPVSVVEIRKTELLPEKKAA